MSEYTESTKFIDLNAQQQKIRKEIDIAITNVLNHGQYIMGPEVKEFEEALRKYTGAKHALTCANGTDALTLALMAWGVGKGDAVFVPSFTYVASAEAPAQLCATPFFVDVIESNFNIDPESFSNAIEDALKMGLKPSVVIVVDLFGHPADVDAIEKIASQHGIKVLVDAAQSFGASSNGRRVGSMGDITTTSFFPAKPLGCYGDGGALFTNDDDLASKINSIRLHGKGTEKYDNVVIGVNSRLDTIQAAILLEKLKIFPRELEERNRVALRYQTALGEYLKTPRIIDGYTSAWAQYTVLSSQRDKLKESLQEQGIPTVVYYPKALTQQSGYKNFPVVSSGVKVSEGLTQKALSLPMHPYLENGSIDTIAKKILDFLQN